MGAVIGLLSERLDKGVTLEQFQDKLKHYVLKHFHRAEDVIPLITNFENPVDNFEDKYAPADLTTEQEAKPSFVKKWELKYKRFLDHEENLTENTNKLYALIMGQCTTALQSVIKGDSEYEAKSRTYDALWIFEKVKLFSAGVDTKANPVLTLHEQLFSFLTMKQGQSESDDDYLKRFNSRVKNLELAGGAHIFCSPKTLGKDISLASPEEIEAESKRFRAICFLLRSDEYRYKELLVDLKKGAYRGRDEYPTTVSGVYELMILTSQQIGYNQRQNRGIQGRQMGRNFTFAQNRAVAQEPANIPPRIVPGRDGVTHNTILCYACEYNGNYADQCPSLRGAKKTQVGVGFSQYTSQIKPS